MPHTKAIYVRPEESEIIVAYAKKIKAPVHEAVKRIIEKWME